MTNTDSNNNSNSNNININNAPNGSSSSGKIQSYSSTNTSPDSDTILPTTSSPQFTREEDDDLFVLEDEYPPVDDYLTTETDDDSKIIWNQLPKPSSFFRTSYLTDLVILLSIIAIVYCLVITTGSLFSKTPYSSLMIDTSLRVLPWYAAQSLTRMIAAYIVSLTFSISYAYLAYRVQFAANILILVIDVLQSIPLLSFLPGVVLGLISIFPDARIGVELAAVLLLVTSMAWNMLLGFYQSLLGIPKDLYDVSKSFKLSDWKRFWSLELPAGVITIVWNSIISVAGGWFFLISIESFELGNRDFKLPGLGSFLAVAAETGNYSAIFAGLAVVIVIIVAIDFFVWRPLIAWSTKFTYGAHSAGDERPKSFVLNTLQRSTLIRSLHSRVIAPAWDDFVNLRYRNPFTGEFLFENGEYNNSNEIDLTSLSTKQMSTESQQSLQQLTYYNNNGAMTMTPSGGNGRPTNQSVFSTLINSMMNVGKYLGSAVMQGVPLGLKIGIWPVLGYCALQAGRMVRSIPTESWILIGTSAAATFGRVIIALGLSLLWTVPAGVAIGRNAKLSALLQPIVQIAASVPATALFPFLLLFLAKLGGGLEIGSIALMMLGTMWYILFNVIAGAQAIPNEFFDVDNVYNKEGSWLKRWRKLIMPGIFPYLITGIVTAVGGAWNASIVSEYVVFRGGVMKTHGLGALISQAAASGDYAILLASTVVMSLLVLLTNKFVWTPLYRLAETKYRI